MRATREARTADPAHRLLTRYDGVICDLDGVVYRGTVAIPGAIETLNRASDGDVPVVFATNNASRSPDTVGDHLRELGMGPSGWSVVTSSQAAAVYLADRLPPRVPVCAVGGPGVTQALTEVGLTPVRVSDLNGTSVGAVVQGLGIDVAWHELAEIAYLVEGGALWVATNLDRMLPTSRGAAPGNGALVAAVQTATSRRPHVVGKPGPALFDLARTRLGTEPERTLVCGDRLDTDIEGANAAGVDSLFVLSGAHRLRDLAFAAKTARPTYVASDLRGILQPGRRLDNVPDDLVQVTPDGTVLVPGDAEDDSLLQSAVAAAWAALDEGRPVSGHGEMWRGLERRLGLVGQQTRLSP